MKSTGIIKSVDALGRFKLPMELRTLLNIHDSDSLIIQNDSGNIAITKLENKCVFCDSINVYYNFKNKCICKNCFKNFTK